LTSSVAAGTDAPPKPPLLADQLAVLFQLEAVADTQKRAADDRVLTLVRTSKTKMDLMIFINSGSARDKKGLVFQDFFRVFDAVKGIISRLSAIARQYAIRWEFYDRSFRK
jgi:hypothetical protein